MQFVELDVIICEHCDILAPSSYKAHWAELEEEGQLRCQTHQAPALCEEQGPTPAGSVQGSPYHSGKTDANGQGCSGSFLPLHCSFSHSVANGQFD